MMMHHYVFSIARRIVYIYIYIYIYYIILLLLLDIRQITVTLSQPNVAAARYKVSEDMAMSFDA